jgi:sugar lactone lactonase YvrE
MCWWAQVGLLAAFAFIASSLAAGADPQLADPTVGSLELVTPDPAEQAKLNAIDGLAFDSFGNLFGTLELAGSAGAVVYIDKVAGTVTELVSGIARADQIARHPSGDLYVTSEVGPAATNDRIYRLMITYDANHAPLSAAKNSLTTSLGVANPEGLAILDAAGAYGNVGDLAVCEDSNPGNVLGIVPGAGTTTVRASGLARPEGVAFGSLGAESPALYVAETRNHRVLRIDPDGASSVVGDPTSVALTAPDNVEFGPHGTLYVSEDRPLPNSRVLQIAANGTHSVFATGFSQAQGLAFDAATGDLYIAEQNLDRVWRVRFARPAQLPALGAWGLACSAALLLAFGKRWQRNRGSRGQGDGSVAR